MTNAKHILAKCLHVKKEEETSRKNRYTGCLCGLFYHSSARISSALRGEFGAKLGVC